jgi:hypothetical protein
MLSGAAVEYWVNVAGVVIPAAEATCAIMGFIVWVM